MHAQEGAEKRKRGEDRGKIMGRCGETRSAPLTALSLPRTQCRVKRVLRPLVGLGRRRRRKGGGRDRGRYRDITRRGGIKASWLSDEAPSSFGFVVSSSGYVAPRHCAQGVSSSVRVLHDVEISRRSLETRSERLEGERGGGTSRRLWGV